STAPPGPSTSCTRWSASRPRPRSTATISASPPIPIRSARASACGWSWKRSATTTPPQPRRSIHESAQQRAPVGIGQQIFALGHRTGDPRQRHFRPADGPGFLADAKGQLAGPAQVDRAHRAGAGVAADPVALGRPPSARRTGAALAAACGARRAWRAVRADPGHTAERLVVQLGHRQAAAVVQAVQPAAAGDEERRAASFRPRCARIPVLASRAGAAGACGRRAEASCVRQRQRAAPDAAVRPPAQAVTRRRPPMKRLAIPLLALALPGIAAATDYIVQPASSTLGFSNTFQGESFDGHFGQWTAAISYDPANLAASKFDVEVTLASVKTGDSDRDSALPGKDFFDTTGFRRQGDQVIAGGNLTLRGVTRPVSLDVAFKPQAGGAVLDVAGTVKRLDFGVGSGD